MFTIPYTGDHAITSHRKRQPPDLSPPYACASTQPASPRPSQFSQLGIESLSNTLTPSRTRIVAHATTAAPALRMRACASRVVTPPTPIIEISHRDVSA